MTAPNVTLAWYQNHLCAAEVTTHWTEPFLETTYWPLRTCSAWERDHYWSQDLGKPLYRDGPTGYSLARPGGGWIPFQLPHGGQTRALGTDRVPVPRPKGLRATTQIRWHQGHWEKATQTKGWVRC